MGRAFEVRKASIMKNGAARGKIYSMYAREIYQAAKNGGTNLESNYILRRLVDKAKTEQVPSDIIKRAIDKVNSGADETYQQARYELFGPAGSTLIVDCLTDNVNRTVSSLRAVVNKAHAKMGAMGSVSYQYEHLCIVFELFNENLFQLLEHNHMQGISLNSIRFITKQILEVTEQIHNSNIIHFDLKPENILLKII